MFNFRSLNKVILIGNIVKDIEVRVTPKGTPVASIVVATNVTWKDASGAQKEQATFHRLTAWGNSAQAYAKLLRKGVKVCVEGRLVNRKKIDATGKTSWFNDIIVTEVILLENLKRPEGATSYNSNSSNNSKIEDALSDTNTSFDAEPEGNVDLNAIMQELEGEEETKLSDKKTVKKEEPEEDDLPF